MNGEAGPWFVKRSIGFGWRPATWQGWVITVVFVGCAVVAAIVARTAKSPAVYVVAVAAIAAYTAIAATTSRARPSATSQSGGGMGAPDEPAVRARDERTGTMRDERTVTLRDERTGTAGDERTGTARGAPVRREAHRVAGPPALVADGLTRRFGERVAVDGVSFSVARGEVFGFLGPNGAGKTTTVRVLGTLIRPTSGSATVAGVPLTPANGEEIRQRIAIMPEAPGLYLRLSVRENLEFFAGLFGVKQPATRIADAIEAVNLTSRTNDLCGSLSKGLRQRVGLARALVNNPEVLFLDEPTSGLDPVAAREVHELIERLRDRGTTVFLTTHRLAEAEQLCDRVAILNTSLRTVGTPDELRARLFKRSLVVRTAAPLAEPQRVFEPVAGVQSWNADGPGSYVVAAGDPVAIAPAVTRALVAAGADVVSIGESRHSLEDVYFELIDDDVEAHGR